MTRIVSVLTAAGVIVTGLYRVGWRPGARALDLSRRLYG